MISFLKKNKIVKQDIQIKKNELHIDERWKSILDLDGLSLFECKTDEIDKNLFVNWEKNRPPDEVRISEIYNHYNINNVDLIPGIVYAWFNNGKLNIYDGIHRFIAALQCSKKMSFILQIKKSSEQEIIEDFLNINKSISVPSVYLEEGNVIKKLICQNVADMLCKKYPTFVSPSRKPIIYNFNRDNIVEFISTLNIDFMRSNVDLIIFNELLGLNFVAEEFVKSREMKCPKKCHYYKFYLFFLEKNLIKRKIEDKLEI